MKKIITELTRIGYAYIAKPILFRLHPDDVHRRLIFFGSSIQRIPLLNDLPKLWRYTNDRYLSQTIEGVTFRNPVGVSAGFDKNIQLPVLLKAVGFGFMIGGSVTYRECAGNEGRWYYRLPKTQSLVIHAGLPNQGALRIDARIRRYIKTIFDDFPLSVSIAKTNSRKAATDDEAVKDYICSLRLFDTNDRPSIFEINISCPNTYGGEPFTTPDRLEKLLSHIDAAAVSRPVFLKMPTDLSFPAFDALLDVILRHHIQGVTISNLYKDRRTAQLNDPLPDSIPGNLSGRPCRTVSTELIRRTYRKCGGRLVIIGVGGVFTAQDAYDKIKAGAHLIALVTGMIFEGPQLVGEINRELVALLKKDGFNNITDAVGTGLSI